MMNHFRAWYDTLAGTTLNFGSNEGWIAFEIDENAEGLELSYPFEAEEYHCAL